MRRRLAKWNDSIAFMFFVLVAVLGAAAVIGYLVYFLAAFAYTTWGIRFS